MEPEVTPGLTENCLVVVMHLLMADPTWVDGRSVGVLRVEDHRLVGRVNLKLMCESGTYWRRLWSKIFLVDVSCKNFGPTPQALTEC